MPVQLTFRSWAQYTARGRCLARDALLLAHAGSAFEGCDNPDFSTPMAAIGRAFPHPRS